MGGGTASVFQIHFSEVIRLTCLIFTNSTYKLIARCSYYNGYVVLSTTEHLKKMLQANHFYSYKLSGCDILYLAVNISKSIIIFFNYRKEVFTLYNKYFL